MLRGAGGMGERLNARLGAALALLERAGAAGGDPRSAREAASGLYYVTAAALLLARAGEFGDPIAADLARLVLAHRLAARDPLAGSSAEDDAAGDAVIDALVAARVSHGDAA